MTPPSADGVVVVTGGSRGIGAATAILLAEQGRKVIIVDILPEPLHDAAVILWREAFDVSNEAAVASGIAAIEDAHGPISGLVNAAGIFGKMHSVERVRMDNWDREINIDLRGTFLVARSVGVRMAGRKHGAIVNVASVAGMTWGALSEERLARNAAMKRLVEQSRWRRPSRGCCRRPAVASPASIFPSTAALVLVRHGMPTAGCAKRHPIEFKGKES